MTTLTERGLWLAVPGSAAEQAVVNRAYSGAEQAVRRAGEGESFRFEAQRRAEQLLDSVGREHGWEVHIRWVDAKPP